MSEKRKDSAREQGRLEFDLPLRAPSAPLPPQPEPAESRQSDLLTELPLFPGSVGAAEESPDSGPKVSSRAAAPAHSEEPVLSEEEGLVDESLEVSREATLALRYLAGLADLAIQGSVLILALVGQSVLGPPPRTTDWPAYLLFLLAFSFLYTVVPLAFWGQTPGMSVVGLVVRSEDGENLTVPETARRWLVGVFTAGFLGLPLLIALTGRSLGDRFSRSSTFRF